MKKSPNLINFAEINDAQGFQVCIDDRWVPARPIGYKSFCHRIKCAWMVFTGKADALVWPCDQ